ncbi:hypothetical protein F5884DRAFT_848002 [Xylogone sp. PMI_703]|nr:hypothetical protein F5884DRAFT_848002 [Xylogone sp. PMI_703]
MPGTTDNTSVLSDAQKEHFMKYGFVKVEGCFTRAQAEEFTSKLWVRLGMSPTDKSTWHTERTNMPTHGKVLAPEFAPKAFAAMCELLGGEERISDTMRTWSDGFIVNLGKDEYSSDQELIYRELDGWHNDGDFFVHFLDSPEQALLVIPLWSDIDSKGGGTVICADGIKHIAQHLYNHPEGVTPWMRSVSDPSHTEYEGREYWLDLAQDPSKTRDESFFEATGKVGDVFLLHPFMLHTASKNLLRNIRVITNPPVSLKEPFCYYREDGNYSLVEQKTLNDLGKPEGLPGWHITKPRKGWIPRRVKRMEEMKRQELERLNNMKQDQIVQPQVQAA